MLEGSIRKSSNRIRVTGQLIDTVSGNHIWAERYGFVVKGSSVERESCKRLEQCWRGNMRPTITRSELAQILRLLLVAALVLGGIGAAIGSGSSALELVAIR